MNKTYFAIGSLDNGIVNFYGVDETLTVITTPKINDVRIVWFDKEVYNPVISEIPLSDYDVIVEKDEYEIG